MKGPDLAALLAAADDSGAALAALIRASRGGSNGQGRAAANGHGDAPVSAVPPTPAEFMAQVVSSRPWDDITATLAAEGRNMGVMRLACSLRGTTSFSDDQAIAEMTRAVWPLIDQGQGGHEFPFAEFEEVIRAVWRQYPGAGDEIEQAVERSTAPAPPPGTAPASETADAAPRLPKSHVELTDALVANLVAADLKRINYCWTPGLGWMTWDGRIWAAVDTSRTWDMVRQYFIWLLREMAKPDQQTGEGADAALLARVITLLSKARISAITDLVRGHNDVLRNAASFDADPDIINTPGGIVSLRTGEVTAHTPAAMCTKITRGNYVPGYTHPDWTQALTALAEPERRWFQQRIGQGITGHPTPDGIMVVLQGSGENGKSCLTTDGPVVALGGYADMASHKLITSQKAGATEHSTEMADLRGQRLLIGEELTEGRSIDVAALKRLMDVGLIKARFVYKDNITFRASHSLFFTTNYHPLINETDHGTWRRLALLVFPYTYRKPGTPLVAENDRHGDPELKSRIRADSSGQHDAIVTWAVDGAIAWYDPARRSLLPTPQVEWDTMAWRSRIDHILGFWQECLAADRSSPDEQPPCITSAHLFEAFTQWMETGGRYGAWTQNTFTSRFGSHEATKENGVLYQVTTRLRNASWSREYGPVTAAKSLPKQARSWVGVRFKTPAEQAKWFRLDALDTAPETFLREPYRGKSSRPCQPRQQDFTDWGSDEPFDPSPGLDDNPVNSDAESPKSPGTDSPKPKKQRKPARPPGPDPELAGAVLPLPAVVGRDQRIAPVSAVNAAALVRAMAGQVLTVDVETTGYPVGHPEYKLRTVQLGNADLAAVFRADDPESRELIAGLLDAAPVLHAHSAAADLVPLVYAGLCDESAWARMHDTVLIAKLADPEMSGSDADGLKELAADVLQDRAVTTAANEARKQLFMSARWLTESGPLTPVERTGWAMVDPACETMIRYAASDVLDTAALPGVLPAVDPAIMARERDVQRICARVSHRGLRLDGAHVHDLISEHEEARDAAGELVRAHGIDNPGSGKQVGEALTALGAELSRTEKGNVSVSAAVLDELATGADDAAELAGEVLEYREHATILGLTLEPFRLLCDHGDSRVRPVVYTLGTATGRMSCVRPNLQQIKRTGGIRACVTADEGWVIVSADFAGVELRVAAALSGDAALQEFIAEEDASRGNKQAKVGLHWKIAHQVWGPEATKANRYAVKRAVFGHVYGGSVRAMANGAGISLADAEAVKATLTQLTPRLMTWSADWSSAVRRGAVTFQSWGGRTIYFDRRAPHKAGNYAIQGTARELLCAALLNWEKTRWGNSVILPVHDEILAVVPAADGASATAELVRCMEITLEGVPIVAEPSEPSFSWQDAD